VVRHFQYYNIITIKRPDNCQLTLTLFGLFVLMGQIMNNKTCTKCKQEKQLIEFNKNKRQNDGFQTYCKVCQKEYIKQNKLQLEIYYQDWFSENKQERNEYNKLHRKKNLQKYKNYNKQYRSKESYKEKRRQYERNLAKNSLIFRVKNNLRKRIGSFFKGKGKSKSTEKILGCSYQEFIFYLENKFTDGMSWGNYGLYGWHIDHITPLSSATDESSLERLCHYTNLQPLWAKDNLSKGDKII